MEACLSCRSGGLVQTGHFVSGIRTELCYRLYASNCHGVLKDLDDELSLFWAIFAKAIWKSGLFIYLCVCDSGKGSEEDWRIVLLGSSVSLWDRKIVLAPNCYGWCYRARWFCLVSMTLYTCMLEQVRFLCSGGTLLPCSMTCLPDFSCPQKYEVSGIDLWTDWG